MDLHALRFGVQSVEEGEREREGDVEAFVVGSNQ